MLDAATRRSWVAIPLSARTGAAASTSGSGPCGRPIPRSRNRRRRAAPAGRCLVDTISNVVRHAGTVPLGACGRHESRPPAPMDLSRRPSPLNDGVLDRRTSWSRRSGHWAGTLSRRFRIHPRRRRARVLTRGEARRRRDGRFGHRVSCELLEPSDLSVPVVGPPMAGACLRSVSAAWAGAAERVTRCRPRVTPVATM